MKIEKISDNQIKLILTKSDLLERDIQLEELASPSEKTQALFRDIMEQALEECDFVSGNTPLMVEALPVGMDGIMIIVTKIEDKEQKGNNFRLISQTKEQRRFKKKPLAAYETSSDSDIDVLIYSFHTLDDVIDVSVRLSEAYHGSSSLYKQQNRYFLILQNDQPADELETEDLDWILGEYGQKHVSSPLSKSYLMEHGEPILKNKAVKTLAKSFSS